MPGEMGFGLIWACPNQEQKARQGLPAFGDLRLLVIVCVPDSGGLYESWSAAFSVLLSTPVAVFAPSGCCGAPGLCLALSIRLTWANRKRCLLANRVGDAHWPGRKNGSYR